MQSKLIATCLALALCLPPAFAQETPPAPVPAAVTPAATDAPAATAIPPAPAAPEVVSGGWLEMIEKGGTVGYVQIGLSIFGMMFAIERFLHLRRKYVAPVGLTQKAIKLWNEGKFAELEAMGEREPSTLARVISFIVRHREEPMAEVSIMAGDIVSQELKLHGQRAYPLGVIATIEPLLGLLGMIVGMIHTFEIVAVAGALGDPSQLASGISEALVTTGLGLAIAIPFLIMHHFFKNRIGFFSAALEKDVTSLLSEWFFNKSKGGSNAH